MQGSPLRKVTNLKTPDASSREFARLKTLRLLDVLDTAAEERFDRLTRMAKRMFDVPIALVSLVDADRQWFKSCQGFQVKETSRDISFCGHAILGDDVFLIPDTEQDMRFADNPLVVEEPHIRFYAGCPVKAPDGHKLGTLCIIDRIPRHLDGEDLDILRDLASMVEKELEAVQLATMDELTNISNRRGFLMLAQHALNLCIRQEIPVTLVFFDLNEFKPINDRFGHAEGDRVLRAFADQMKNSFRNSDVFARLGGDEFVVLLTNSEIAMAEDIVGRFHTAMEQYAPSNNCNYTVAFSHGVIQFQPEQHTNLETLLADGDALMYKRKHAIRLQKSEPILPPE